MDLSREHRATPMVGRTLTQHAVPITFGLKAASWLTGLLDAAEALAGVRSRLAGAARWCGRHARRVHRAGPTPGTDRNRHRCHGSWSSRSPRRSGWLPRRRGTRRGALITAAATPWSAAPTRRDGSPPTSPRLSRPEIAELAEGSGGGSSTMPQKHNPVLSVLIRRAALTGPPLASTLHLAAATNVDERPDGSWHAEWATLRDLARRTVAAASQASDLITGLVSTKIGWPPTWPQQPESRQSSKHGRPDRR